MLPGIAMATEWDPDRVRSTDGATVITHRHSDSGVLGNAQVGNGLTVEPVGFLDGLTVAKERKRNQR